MRDWTPRQLQAIALFATGMSVAEVRKRIGVADRTLWYWRADPAFREAVREALTAVLDEALGKLVTTAPKAVDVISRCVDGEPVDPGQLAEANWVLQRFDFLTRTAGLAGDSESRVTVSQTVSGRPADVAALAQLLANDRATAGASGVVFSGELAAAEPAEDSASG